MRIYLKKRPTASSASRVLLLVDLTAVQPAVGTVASEERFLEKNEVCLGRLKNPSLRDCR